MARQHPPLLALNRGEVSKIALARVDVEKLRLATQVQVNWMPFVIGPAMVRPGLQYVGGVLSDLDWVPLPFVFSKSDAALLELTANVMRVWINDAVLTRAAVSTTISDPSFAGGGAWSSADTTSGASVTIAGGVMTLTCTPIGGLARAKQTIAVASGDRGIEHGLRITVTNGPVTVRAGSAAGLADFISTTALDTGTHSLALTPTGDVYLQIESTAARSKTLTQVTFESAGTLQVPTPWGAGDLANIRAEQSGDIVYVSCYGKQQYKIERRGTRPGARGWSVVKYRSDNGPFKTGAGIDANLLPDVFYGNGNLTSDRPYFTSSHVGALFRLFTQGQTNQAVLGGQNAFTVPIRVAGVGNDRKFGVHISGTFAGTVSVQRSLVGPDSGFVDFKNATVAGTINIDDTTGTGAASLNNVVAWYRAGFKSGDYTSGNATVFFGTNDGGIDTTVNGTAHLGGGRYGICRVTGYVSSTQVTIEVLEPISAISATRSWQESDWSDYQGWPDSGQLHEGRLWWFGRDRVWGGQSDNYTGYAQADQYGNSLGDAGAILEAFGSGPIDRVNWGLSLSRILCGREGSVASIRSSSFDTPLTPTNFTVKDCSTHGAGRLPAVKRDTRGIYVEKSGRRVYELMFNPQALDYQTRDLTRLNLDIGKPGFVSIAVARQPDTQVLLPRTEGQCAVLLHEPDDEVECWWRIMTLGVIERAAVLPSATGIEDQIYFGVKRFINGTTKRFIEKLAVRDNCVGGLLNQMADSFVSYSGAATNTITLAHLPNTSVVVWADGQVLSPVTTSGSGVAALSVSAANIVAGLGGATNTHSGAATNTVTGLAAYNGLPAEVFAGEEGKEKSLGAIAVSGGILTLPNGLTATSIVAFFGYMAPLMSSKLAYGAQLGTALTQKKKLDHVGLVAYDLHPSALQMGQSFSVMDAMPELESDTTVSQVWPEYDEPMFEVPGEWKTDARLCVLGQAPYPAKIGGVALGIMTEEKA